VLSRLRNALVREYRAHRLARFTFWALAYGLALFLLEKAGAGASGPLWFLFWISALVSGIYYATRALAFVRERMLWRLRRRLIVTYLFIAVVPIILILVLVAIKDFLSSGQFAAYLVAAKLRDHSEKLQELNRSVAHVSQVIDARTPAEFLTRLEAFAVPDLEMHASSFPELELTIHLGARQRGFTVGGKPSEPAGIPAWLKGQEFSGIVIDGDLLALRAATRASTPHGELTVIHTQPISPRLLDRMGAGIGPVSVLPSEELRGAGGESSGPVRFRVPTAGGQYVQEAMIQSREVRLPERVTLLDSSVVGTSTLEPTIWTSPTETRASEPVFVFVTSRISTLNRAMLAALGRYSRAYVILFIVVGLVFLGIELVALIIGIRLTRSITSTVDRLYDATERVKGGDLDYRINLPARDQLTALGAAFDSMTESVQRLLREVQEKSKLESELAIAREVQNELFPDRAPQVAGLDLHGVCLPARLVSGDYFDFLKVGDRWLGLALADVSGKGISAALLMAAIQSALRAQQTDGLSSAGPDRAGPLAPSTVVARLNRQLFESTSREKYATFFYAVYDAETHKLAYTNAGHLPPLLFRGDRIVRLAEGGPVVGLFDNLKYEQSEVELQSGDLILAYSDGVTEPENTFGEEFGEDRVIEVVRRALPCSSDELVEEICRAVNDWTGSPELQDDMTLVVARRAA
jgi:sigma-B regulation protein RsbU (phosphoserine phosphatase)